jgi:hypothetical protein
MAPRPMRRCRRSNRRCLALRRRQVRTWTHRRAAASLRRASAI